MQPTSQFLMTQEPDWGSIRVNMFHLQAVWPGWLFCFCSLEMPGTVGMLWCCNWCAQLLLNPIKSKDRDTEGRDVWKVGSISTIVAQNGEGQWFSWVGTISIHLWSQECDRCLALPLGGFWLISVSVLLPHNFTLACVVLNKEDTLIIPFACELITVKLRVWGLIIGKASDIKNY